MGGRGLLGALLGWIARLWVATLRVRFEIDASLEADERPRVLAFLHGRQLPLLALPRRAPTAVLVSLSRDGELQARALGVNGLVVVRGSSSRGGARGLVALVRRMRAACDAAFAVDGPKGPYGRAKPGAALAARAVGGVLVPVGSAARPARVLGRAWDRFVVPLPFARAAVVIGAPIAPEDPDATAQLETAIERANARAEALVA